MTRTTKIILASVMAVILLTAAVVVKMIFFPSVKEAWFQTNGQKLRQVPGGFAVVRPTHFPKSATNGMAFTNVKGKRWMVGRNVTFKELMATAYSYDSGRVWLPPSVPKGNFDFLVTALSDPEEHLRTAIRKKTDYVAHPETRDADVLALKVEDPNSPGLRVSTSTKDDVTPKGGRLYFTHQRLTVVTDGLEHMLKTPVVDKTGLSNFYDFSLAWDPQTQRQIQSGTLDPDTGKKILDEWGLGLEPDTASIEMLVVEKAK